MASVLLFINAHNETKANYNKRLLIKESVLLLFYYPYYHLPLPASDCFNIDGLYGIITGAFIVTLYSALGGIKSVAFTMSFNS